MMAAKMQNAQNGMWEAQTLPSSFLRILLLRGKPDFCFLLARNGRAESRRHRGGWVELGAPL